MTELHKYMEETMLIGFRVQDGMVFDYWKPLMHKATDRLVKELERTELQSLRLYWSTVEDGWTLNLHLQGFSPTRGEIIHVSRRVISLEYVDSENLDDLIGAFVTSVLHSLNTELNEGLQC